MREIWIKHSIALLIDALTVFALSFFSLILFNDAGFSFNKRAMVCVGIMVLGEIVFGSTPGQWAVGFRIINQHQRFSYLVKCGLRSILRPGSIFIVWATGLVCLQYIQPESFIFSVIVLLVFSGLLLTLPLGIYWVEKKFELEFEWRSKHVFMPSVAIISFLIMPLLYISLPGLLGAHHRQMESQVRKNMRALQNMVEKYAETHGGVYPENLHELKQAANSNPELWQEISNPYTKEKGIGLSMILEQNIMQTLKPGMVSYQTLESHRHYVVYGYDYAREKIQLKGQIFALTND